MRHARPDAFLGVWEWESGSGSLGCWKAVSVAASLVAAQATTRAEIAPGAGPVNPRPPTLPAAGRMIESSCTPAESKIETFVPTHPVAETLTLSRCDSFPSRAKHSDRHLILVPYQYVN
jgi:hypothetical protein